MIVLIVEVEDLWRILEQSLNDNIPKPEKIICSSSVGDALRAINDEQQIDLLLVGGDFIEAVGVFKKKFPDKVIFGLTSVQDKIEAFRNLGANRIFIKPFRLKELQSAYNQLSAQA